MDYELYYLKLFFSLALNSEVIALEEMEGAVQCLGWRDRTRARLDVTARA